MVNKDKIIEGIKLILEGIGEDVTREGLVETPDRLDRMYEEIFYLCRMIAQNGGTFAGEI